MLKKMLSLIALCVLSFPVLAVTIPGESTFCLNNCINGICQPVVTTAGTINYSIGLSLGVFDPNGGNFPFQQAYFYQWAQTMRANGTPTNLGGMPSDTGPSWTFGVVQPADAGLYVEIGYAPAGSTAVNWCVTVN